MKIKGTKEAFAQLIMQKGFARKSGYNKATVSGWIRRIKDGKVITTDKMEEVLLKCGGKVVVEKTWNVPVI